MNGDAFTGRERKPLAHEAEHALPSPLVTRRTHDDVARLAHLQRMRRSVEAFLGTELERIDPVRTEEQELCVGVGQLPQRLRWALEKLLPIEERFGERLAAGCVEPAPLARFDERREHGTAVP